MLFPYSLNVIDGALAQVILQVVGGDSYVEAVLAETIRSLDYVREIRRGRMRGSPHLLQIWFLAHIRPFGLSHPFSCITDERSLIVRLPHVFRPSDRNYTDWTRFMEELTPAQFLWTRRWNPGGPMIIGYPSVIGLPLISHLGSTLIFPARVIRKLGGLQDIPIEADRTPHRFRWANTTASLPDRVLRVREVLTTSVASISYSCTRKNGRRATTRYLGARRTTNPGTLPFARHTCDVASRCIYGVFWCSSNALPSSYTGAIQCY
ncbi:hypothetical protein CRG98_032278 [Punica granatum]|uniref:DUF7745 domain-containing protein n=1 Tax=Punica granatum TaxID=22663 RepID=A0A2I0ITI7_PUNGR|nr:hypothetical protein CRG98_032278 [Punica granatum]